MATRFETHEVVNQPPPLTDYNAFGADVALGDALEREGAAWASAELLDLGNRAGSFDAQELGRRANENVRHHRLKLYRAEFQTRFRV